MSPAGPDITGRIVVGFKFIPAKSTIQYSLDHMVMLKKPPAGLFITGTDTEVGKTYVATLVVKSLVAAGHKVGVYKPAASDCVSDGNQLIAEDALALWDAAGRPLGIDQVCPQRFRAPIAPHLSAKSEGKQVDPELLRSGISAWADQLSLIHI